MHSSNEHDRDTLGALSTRLATLERHNRRLLRTQQMLLGGLAALAVIGATRPPDKVVTAEQFVLVDAQGNECGAWSTHPVEGRGTSRTTLVFRGDGGPSIRLDSGEGHPSIQFDGSVSGERASGNQHVTLGIHETWGPQLALRAWETPPEGSANTSSQLDLLVGLPFGHSTYRCIRAMRGLEELWVLPEDHLSPPAPDSGDQAATTPDRAAAR